MSFMPADRKQGFVFHYYVLAHKESAALLQDYVVKIYWLAITGSH